MCVPLRRRLQTYAVLLCTLILPAHALILALAAFWKPAVEHGSRWILLLLAIWTVIDNTLLRTPWRFGRPLAWLRTSALFRAAASFFPAAVHVVPGATYKEGSPYLFCVHPHGVLSVGVITGLAWRPAGLDAPPAPVDYRVATIALHWWVPLWRDFVLAMGFVDASRASLAALLASGRSAVIVVGGAAEALLSAPSNSDIVLRRRRGFVRLALETGAALVPCFTFGENELWDPVLDSAWLRLQRALLRLTGFVVPLVRGRGVFQYDVGLLPRRVPLHTVLGAPLPVRRVPRPSDAQVDALHARYAAALEALVEAHRAAYAPHAPPLRIVD